MSRLRCAFPPVVVREPDDVVEVGRRNLDDQRVLERTHPVHGAGWKVEGLARSDLALLELAALDGAELECGPTFLDVPGFVLALVVLERERLPGPDEEQLAGVTVGLGPDQLPAPGLLDFPRLDLHDTPSHPGCAATCSWAVRRSFGVLTVIQNPSCRNARSFRSAASTGKVV